MSQVLSATSLVLTMSSLLCRYAFLFKPLTQWTLENLRSLKVFNVYGLCPEALVDFSYIPKDGDPGLFSAIPPLDALKY
jgi:hypothetical protein